MLVLQIRDELNCHVAIEKLRSLLQINDFAIKTAATRALVNLCQSESTTIVDHIAKFENLLMKANYSGLIVDSLTMIQYFLDSLNPSFEEICTAHRLNPALSYLQLKRHAIQLGANRRRSRTDVVTAPATFPVQVRPATRSMASPRPQPKAKKTPAVVQRLKRNVTCHWCGKQGHTLQECHTCLGTGAYKTRGPQPKTYVDQSTALSGSPATAAASSSGVPKLSFGSVEIQGSSSFAGVAFDASTILLAGVHERPHNTSPWVVDSGATHHICGDKHLLTNLQDLKTPMQLQGITSQFSVTKFGHVVVKSNDGRSVRFTDVLYHPAVLVNLLSLGALHKAGWKSEFTRNGGSLSKEGATFKMHVGGSQNRLRIVNFMPAIQSSFSSYTLPAAEPNAAELERANAQPPLDAPTNTLENWHYILGH